VTEPLSIQVARQYGYGRQAPSRSMRFKEWIQNYADSLNLDSLYFKPIEIWDFALSNKNKKLSLTKEMLKHIFEPIRTDDIGTPKQPSVILNPNFIYKLKGGVYYIPIEIPFDSLTSNSTINNMKGIYIYPKLYGVGQRRRYSPHTYTKDGFNLLSSDRAIIGIAPFPTPMKFMNWQQNPLNFKPTNQYPSSSKEEYDETVNWLKENFKGE